MDKLSQSRVSLFTNLMYAMGDFPFSFGVTLIGFFLMIYLTNTVGISSFWAGFIIFASIIWDAITDPIVGYINDNTRSRLGRRRKYLFLFLLPMAITFLMLFSVPSLFRDVSEIYKVAVTLSVYLIFMTFMTLTAVPFGAIINEITDDYDDRTKMMTFRMISSIVGTLMAIVIPEFFGISNATQSNIAGYITMGAVFALLMVIFGYSSTLALRERSRNIDQTKHGFDFRKYFVNSWHSIHFRQVTLMYMLSVAVLNFIQGNLIFFINYKLLLPGVFLPIAGGVMVLAILFMPIWAVFSNKTSKRTAYIASAGILAASLLSLYFVPAFDYQKAGIQVLQASKEMLLPQYKDLIVHYIPDINKDYYEIFKILWQQSPWIFASLIFLSFGFSGVQMLPLTMVPDAINFAANASERREGAYFGIVTFVQKIGWGLGMLLTGAILSVAGYLETAKVFTRDSQNNVLNGMIVLQTPSAIVAINLLFSVMPGVFAILGIMSVWKYAITREALKRQIEMLDETATENFYEVHEVNNMLEIENFVRLHEIIYQNESCYVHPLRKDFVKTLKSQLLLKKYHHPVAAFNVYKNSRISGRVWVAISTIKEGTIKEKTSGYFNYFEADEDEKVVKLLFDKVKEWFITNGVTNFVGNSNPDDLNDMRGILVEGFDEPPVIMCSYNKPYYSRLLEEYGLVVDESLFGYKLSLEDVPYERYEFIEIIKSRYGFNVRSADKNNIDGDTRDIIRIITESSTGDWDMEIPEPDDIKRLIKDWKDFLDFNLIKIAYTNEGRPIGFGMAIPNFNEVLQKVRGSSSIITFFKIWHYKNKIKSLRALVQMVVEDYQGKGVINAIYQDVFSYVKQKGIVFVDASTIGSDNLKSRFAIEKLGGVKYKVFNVYKSDCTLHS